MNSLMWGESSFFSLVPSSFAVWPLDLELWLNFVPVLASLRGLHVGLGSGHVYHWLDGVCVESWLENSSWAGTRTVWRFFFPGRSTHFSRTGIWPSNPSSRESGCFLGLPLRLFTMLFPVLACLWSLLTFKILLTWSRFFLVVRILEKAHIFRMSHWISSTSLCLCLLL